MTKRVLFFLMLWTSLVIVADAMDRALVVGVNYYKQPGIRRTEGSVEDAEAIKDVLQTRFSFAPSSITVLRNEKATAQNILLELDRLVKETKYGDRVFFHYSGHGYQVFDDPAPYGDERDGLDEVIAPYDVSAQRVEGGKLKLALTKGSYISDDTINSYIVKLAGRSVVMFFDSCSSGTLSRGITNDASNYSRYLSLNENSRSFSDKDAYSYQPAEPASRDLSLIRDQNLGNGDINGVVVISAASPYQEAFPVKVGNGYRGAAAFLFEQMVRSGNPTLQQIRNKLVQEIQGARFAKQRDNSFQKPEVDVLSKNDLWNKPLYGWAIANTDFQSSSSSAYTNGLESALTNQYSKIKVGFSLKWNGLPEENANKKRFDNIFYLGDELNFTVETNEDGYLYVFVFSANKIAACMFPAYVEKDGNLVPADIANYVKAGVHNFPREASKFPSVKEPYTPYVSTPIGRDVWVAILSKQKFDVDRQSYTWDEVFQLLGLSKIEKIITERTRGAGNKSPVTLTETDWQSAIIAVQSVNQ
jgi:hypothetical protein